MKLNGGRTSPACLFEFLAGILLLAGFVKPAAAEVALKRVASGFESPVYMADPNDGTGRLFVVELGGIVKILQNGRVRRTPFLDLRSKITSAGEQGLLGFAFDPKFKTNGRFFVNYSRAGDGATVVSSFTVSKSDPNRANGRSEQPRLRFAQPFGNHNGGHLAFGRDKFLYIASGDGGSAGDPFGNGQRLDTVLGKILRIDVSGSKGYKIPTSNPFRTRAGARKEIFAYGLRNPWRFSFDRSNGRLFAGDVGQNRIEEVDLISAGDNLGWNAMEGNDCYPDPNVTCDQTGLRLPIATYAHDEGQSITGGYFYRGSQVSELRGRYVFADFSSGTVFALRQQSDNSWTRSTVLNSGLNPSSFAEDRRGELYLVDLNGGIYKFIHR